MFAIRRAVPYVLISLFLSCSVGFCSQKDQGRPLGKNEKFNVVLIILHAFPRNHLGCYGYPENTSPAIDALSRDGITFNNAFCQFPLTLPSIVSIYTSLYPSSHQIVHIFKDKVPDKAHTLADILKIYGYFTVWFGNTADPLMGANQGALKGFDELCQLRPRSSPKEILSWIKRHDKKNFFLTIHPYWTHPKTTTVDIFDNRFSRRVPRRFFDEIDQSYKNGWMNIQEKLKTDPAFLYQIFGEDWVTQNQQLLLQPYSSRLRVLFGTEGGAFDQNFHRLSDLFLWPVDKFLNSLEGQQLQYYLWLLDSALLEIDEDYVRQVVNTLKKEGIYDKTIIIVTADHGNEYKEHGQMGHGRLLYDEALKIPMIFHIPGLGSGVKIDSIVESVDILPTVCDLLGIPVPYQAQGVSLRKLWEGGDKGGEERYTISQSIGSKSIARNLAAIRSRRWKLIMDEEGLELKELYDMKKDPGELQNVISGNLEVAKELSEKYISKIKSLPSYQNSKSEFFPNIDEKTRKRIQETGYW